MEAAAPRGGTALDGELTLRQTCDPGEMKMPSIAKLFVALVLVLDIGSALCSAPMLPLGQSAAVLAALVMIAVAGYWLHAAWRSAVRLQGASSALRSAADSASRVPRWMILLWLAGWLANAGTLSRAPLHFSWMQAGVLASGAAVLLHALVRPRNSWQFFGFVVLLGMAMRLASLPAVPIDPKDGDMLPVVRAALDRFLEGSSPYRLYHMPWPLPLVYSPLTWLAYLPPHVLGIDVRVTNLLLELSIGALLFSVASRSKQPAPVHLLWAWLFSGATMTLWSLHITHFPLWLLTLLLLVLLAKERMTAAALVFGLCAASSQLAMLMAPFLLIFLLRSGRFLYSLRLCAISIAAAAAFYLPFILWDAQALVLGLLRWHNTRSLIDYEIWKLNHGGAQVGLAGFLDRCGLYAILKPMQAAILLALAVLYRQAGATLRLLGPFLIAAIVSFMALNPLIRGHYYGIVLIIGLFSAAYESELPRLLTAAKRLRG